MTLLRLNRYQLFFSAVIWQYVFLALSASQFNNFQLLNIFGFLTLILLPGLLTMLMLRLGTLPFWAYIGLAVGLSLLELMTIGLIGNAVLPFAGIARPLDGIVLLVEFSALINVLLVFGWEFMGEVVLPVRRFVMFDTVRDTVFALIPSIFVVLAVLGAMRLNNGADGALTLLMLAGLGLYSAILLWQSKNLGANVAPTVLFFMALALLLMTSLRGWYITGHDLQREYGVFQLTKASGVWNIANYRDAYNACMSITILPTMFANLLKIADPYVYKVLYQLLFATVAPVAYLIARTVLSARLALLSAVFFVAFPTFSEDMPFLARQEVAFLFYGLILYVLFCDSLSSRLRTTLFLLMAGGVVLSHYSTTYTIIVIFGLVLAFIAFSRFIPRLTAGLRNPGVRRITPLMLVSLILMSFFWTVVVTDTGGNVRNVAVETLSAIGTSFTASSRSVDAVSLITFGKPHSYQTLEPYITDAVLPLRQAEPDAYYPASSYTQYQYSTLKEDVLPPTKLSSALAALQVNAPAVVSVVGQGLAKLMELCVLIGFLLLLFGRVKKKAELEWFLLALASLLFIGLNVILPVLSTEYGVFRALQQSLFILGPCIVLGLYWLGARWSERVAERFAIVMGICFFLYSSACIPQLFGGNAPALHLSNAGFYYDKYLVQGGEIAAAGWLKTHENEPNFEVQADRFGQNKLTALGLSSGGDIFPGLVKKNAYAFLDAENVVKQQSSVLYGGLVLVYPYPAFLDQQKDLVYNNGDSKIYR